MPVQGSLTLSDIKAAQRLHYRSRPWIASIGALAIVWPLWIAIAWRNWAMALLPVYLAAVAFIYVPLKARRNFRQNKALSEPMTIELREDGLYFVGNFSSGLIPWAHIYKWKSNSQIALIYRTSTMFHLIPSRFFSSANDYDAFLKSLRAKTDAAT